MPHAESLAQVTAACLRPGVFAAGIRTNGDGVINEIHVLASNSRSPKQMARDIQSALDRIRDHATPPNALRLHIDTPCSKVGHCVDCDASTRVCRAVLILERPTMGRKTHVIIVGEDLGY